MFTLGKHMDALRYISQWMEDEGHDEDHNTVVSDQEKISEMNFEFIGLNQSNRSLVIGYEPKMLKNGL